MSDPPFQNDPQSQDDPVLVTHPDELPAALRQHGKQVVIENTPGNARLRQDFEWLLRWQRQARNPEICFDVYEVITDRYKLDADWRGRWDVTEVDGKIKLTLWSLL